MYSSLSSSLAGVITEPAALTSVAECFMQALLWLLLTRVDEFTAFDTSQQGEEDKNRVVRIGTSPGLAMSSSIEAIDPGSWPSSTEEEEKTPWAARSSLHPLPLHSGGKQKLASITGANIKYLGDIGRQFSR